MDNLKVGDKIIYCYGSWASEGYKIWTISKVNKVSYSLTSGASKSNVRFNGIENGESGISFSSYGAHYIYNEKNIEYCREYFKKKIEKAIMDDLGVLIKKYSKEELIKVLEDM